MPGNLPRSAHPFARFRLVPRSRLVDRARGAREAAISWVVRPGGSWRAWLLRRSVVARLGLAAVTVATEGCVPQANPGGLQPTLSIEHLAGGDVAVQDGIPVPTFDIQADRPRIDLDGQWRVERHVFDSDLSLTPRSASLARIEADGGDRLQPGFDDSHWETLAVPGTLNPPPDRTEVGAWYRRSFAVPGGWSGRAATLKFGAANYLADVWLNGHYLGYHEGGTTPFAFDAGPYLEVGARNVLVVRVDNPAWGTRNDILPWGLDDWWNFGGLTRSVWLEASDPVSVVRADVSPHLDGADVGLVISNRGAASQTVSLAMDVLPALVNDANLLNPSPASLISPGPPLAHVPLDPVTLDAGGIARADAGFLLAGATNWSPSTPALYVLRVTASIDGEVVDTLYESFGLRKIAVDADRPVIRLNGRVAVFPGVAIHDQHLDQVNGTYTGGLPTERQVYDDLLRARQVGAVLVRTGHEPANPDLLRLADRLGFAIWEEIPLYHYTPQTFGIAMGRGIPQQMLREMALRDMNRPSVLFHGLANEATGDDSRLQALRQLRDVDRAIDGTRLTGQAAYGFNPTDRTSDPLDVAGYTFYHGVFYGSDPAKDTAAALEAAHATYPTKPIMILEFGRWADNPFGLSEQKRIFEATAPELFVRRASLQGGFVAAGVWWTLDDYATLRPNLEVEHFGLFDLDGRARPVAAAAESVFTGLNGDEENSPAPAAAPGGRGGAVVAGHSGRLLLGYLAYGAAFSLALLGGALALLVYRGGRGQRRMGPAQARRRR